MNSLKNVLLVCLLVVVVALPTAQATCSISAIAIATPSTQYPGWYEYCLSVDYESGVDTLKDVQFSIPCQQSFADSVTITGGMSFGSMNHNPCTVTWLSAVTVLSGRPIVMWYPNRFECVPDSSGMAQLCFVSPTPPAPEGVYGEAVQLSLSHGNCLGTVTGQIPNCAGRVPVEPITWGGIKAMHR